MNRADSTPDVLFARRWQFVAALIAGVVLCWVTAALLRCHGKPWIFSITDARTWQIDRDNNPYNALIQWRAIYTGDYQPIFEAAQGFALDDDFPMYQPEQLKQNRASFVYTPITALACRPVSAPGMTLQESADRVSLVNHLFWLAGGLLLYLIMMWREKFSWFLALMFVVIYLGYFPFAQSLQLTQASLWIYFFLVVAVFCFQRGWMPAAGIALAFGVAIKPHLVVMPIILFFTPQFPRKWLWWCFGVVAACALISFGYAGWDNCWDYATKTLPTLSAGYAYYPNQTLNGMLLRLFEDYNPEIFNLADSHGWIKAWGTAFFIAIPFLCWVICRRRTTEPTPLDNLLCITFALTASVLASPVAWLHHFTALAIPFAVVVRYFIERPQHRTSVTDAMLFLALLLTGWFFDTRDINDSPETLLSGWGFYGMILLFGSLGILIGRDAPAPRIPWRIGNLLPRIARFLNSIPDWRWLLPAIFIFLPALDVKFYGYEYGTQNHAIQIPFVKLLLDPSLYPNDAFMQAMKDYVSWFWVAVAHLSRMVPLEILCEVGHYLTLSLLYGGFFLLVRNAFPAFRWAPLLGVYALLGTNSDFGKEALHWTYFAHTSVATALGIWTMLLVVRGRWIAALALAGLIFDLHAMQSAYLLIMIGAAFCFDPERDWKKGIIGGVAWLILAAPGLWWMFSSQSMDSPSELARLLRAFYPIHFFASEWPWWHWLGLAICLGFFTMCCRQLARTDAVGRVIRMGWAIVLFWLVAGPISEINPPGFLLKLHVFRASSYLVFAVITLGVGWFLAEYPGMFSPAARPAAIIGGLIVIKALGGSGAMDWGRWISILVLLWLVVFGALALLLRSRARYVALGVVGFFIIVSFGEQYYYSNMFNKLRMAGHERWVKAQNWARKNTPRDAVFLTTPEMAGFRVFSERRVVGEWIDGSAAMFHGDFAPQWNAWFHEMGGSLDAMEGKAIWVHLDDEWKKLSQTQIEAMARKHGAQFIVLRLPSWYEIEGGQTHDWVGEPVYRNKVFIIYATPPEPGGDQQDVKESQ